MKRIQKHLSILTVAALLVGAGINANAETKVRIAATVKTPNVTVRIGHTTSSPYRSDKRVYTPVVKMRYYKVTQQDREIASRLSRYAGVPASAMLQFKQRGYTWMEIGRFFNLHQSVVRAAMTGKSWQRFLARNDRGRRGGHRSHRGQEVCLHK